MDIGAGITFGNGVGITKQPVIYLVGTLADASINLQSTGISVDSSGNFYVVGNYASGNPAFLAKYDNNGSLQWKKQISSEFDSARVYSIAVDSSGNIYICGRIYLAGAFRGMLFKINSSGTFVWSQMLQSTSSGNWTPSVNGSGDLYMYGVAVNTSGIPYITGYAGWPFIGAYPTAGGAPTSMKLFYQVQGYTSAGYGIKIDSSGNIYLTGSVTISSNTEMFVAKFNSSGAVQWQKTLSSSGTDTGYGIDVDSSGNVYITGVSNGSGNNDFITAKYNSSGVIQWQKRLGSSAVDQGNGVTVDSSGNVYVTGISNEGSTNDLIIVKYNSSGVIQWQNKIVGGGSGSDAGTAITSITNSDGTVLYVAGYASNASNTAMFLAKLPSDGTGQGTFTLGSYTVTYTASTLTDATSTLTDASSNGTVSSFTMNGDGRGGSTADATSVTSSISQFVPAVPGAPTISTATATSYSTATVAFTAPASDGYSTITTYTATSSPGGITGTLSQAGSGTITVTGLTGSTGYTFTVTATNGIGTSSPSASSNSITTPVTPPSYKAIFGYGLNSSGVVVSMTNKVSNTGVVASDTTGVGTARNKLAAATYGTDKAIFGYGSTDQYSNSSGVSMTNLVTNTGVVGNDVTGVGTARNSPAATGYGTDKAIFGFGGNTGGEMTAITNLVSNTGVVANDTVNVLLVRFALAAAGYGSSGQALFGYGFDGTGISALTNLISNTGVVASNTTGVGTARMRPAAASYGTDKAIFGYGDSTSYGGGPVSMTNKVSNTGVVATDTTGVGTGRYGLAAAGYGSSGQALFGYGISTGVASGATSITNLVSNTGVVSTDTAGVGTARGYIAGSSYGT